MEYEPVFKLAYSNVFITDFFIEAYATSEPIVVIKNGKWQFFLSKEILKNLAERGYKIALGEEAYKIYEAHLKDFLKRVAELQKFDLEKSDKAKFSKFLLEFRKLVIDLGKVYKETEFFYFTKIEQELLNYIKDRSRFQDILSNKVDLANWPSDMRKLADYMINMQHIKFEYRKMMNESMMGEKALLGKILQKMVLISGREDALSMTFEEFIDLLAGKEVPDVGSRHVYAYITWDKESSRLNIFAGAEAYRKIRELEKFIPKNEVIGTSACRGLVKGRVKVIPFSMEPEKYLSKMEKGDILVADTTGPEMMIAIQKAKAIVTDEGGMMSHAAIVSREFGIPCVVGTLYGTEVFKDGDLIEVNANSGVVRKL